MKSTHELLWPVRMLVFFSFFITLVFAPVQPAFATTLTVNSLADTNDGTCNTTNCTLREAINRANSLAGADTITFSVSGTITLGSFLPGLLSTGGALTIDGAGQNVDISGNNTYRVFHIASGATVTLKNLELKNGYAGGDSHGAAIYNDGTLTIQNCNLNTNRAYNKGGGIYNTHSLTITDTNFGSNTTDVGSGGGIFNTTNATVDLIGGDFYSNFAGFGGGAIYSEGDLKVKGTGFYFNQATGNDGGAIYNTGEADIDGSTFSLNEADLYGGAFSNEDGGIFDIKNSIFWLNLALEGGAVYVESTIYPPPSYIQQSKLSNNSANNGAGVYVVDGVVHVHNSVFSYNEATQDGGGVYNQFGSVFIDFSTFDSNEAGGDGGGIYNGGDTGIKTSLFTSNSATDEGGAIYSSEVTETQDIQNNTFYNNHAAKGGGIYLRYYAFIINCTFSANYASTADGGGALNADSFTTLRNSIVANSPSGGNCSSSYFANGGNNIDSGTTCHFDSNKGSLSDTNPLLLALKDNGGVTKTMALPSNSPAVDHVIYNAPNQCPEVDQRDYPRPFGTYCDIGAFERYYRLFLPLTMKN
jgi:CSLREA domain-containing protein